MITVVTFQCLSVSAQHCNIPPQLCERVSFILKYHFTHCWLLTVFCVSLWDWIVTETTLFMRIQNIKNGAQYTDGSFHYSLFFSPLLLLLSFPTECICSNTINVTFTDCLLAFYLNGIQLRLAPATVAAAVTNLFQGGPVLQNRAIGFIPRGLRSENTGITAQTLMARSLDLKILKERHYQQRLLYTDGFDLCSNHLVKSTSELWEYFWLGHKVLPCCGEKPTFTNCLQLNATGEQRDRLWVTYLGLVSISAD